MIVVSDTSPLLNLARIGRLELLVHLYGHVLIPPGVYEELVRNQNDTSWIEPSSTAWLTVASPSDRRHVADLSRNLDRGEAEAIALAVERKADLLLIDEREGRRVATRAGLKIIGLIGVIVAAKNHGLVAQIKPILDELINVARFWISPDLYGQVLAQVGEETN